MLSSIFRTLYGDLSRQEVKKFGLLSATLMFLLGSYWILRLLKKVILEGTVSYDMQPRAKMLSIIVMVCLVFVYAKLIDMFSKQTLFYIVGGSYALIFLLITICTAHPTIGIANTVRSPGRLLGWVSYCLIESFGTIAIQLFWSFVVSVTPTESAKKGFPLIIAGAQIGSITGSFFVMNSKVFGIIPLMLLACGGVAMIPVMIKVFVSTVGIPAVPAEEKKKKKTGIFEGLRLIAKTPYLIGILGVATLYEVVGTIMEFQMDKLAIHSTQGAAGYAAFSGMYGVLINGLAFVLSLLGTSLLMRKMGLFFCLLLFPTVVGSAVVLTYFLPKLGLLVATMVLLKGMSYSLNNPTKDMMYIPTSKDIKFKAKSWVDGFGGRLAKGTGSIITDTLRLFVTSLQGLMNYGTLIALGVVGIWFGFATYVGKAFNKLTKEGKTIK